MKYFEHALNSFWEKYLFSQDFERFLTISSSIPTDMEQKATIDAVFALALGLYTYVNPIPTVTGAPNLVKLLTQDCEQLTGGLLNVEKDSVKAADAILGHIEEKRKKIGI